MPCHKPYELLGPVRVLRKVLGLTANDVTVLTALISYLPRARRETARSQDVELTVVFPSNASLSERANGIDERTLRRSLGRLAGANLIERKNSANGKRFPLRYGGTIRDAFGIDLKPLILRSGVLTAQASKLTAEHERLRSLKAEALALLASLLREESIAEERMTTLVGVRNILRRATLTVDIVLEVIANLRELGADDQASYGERLGSVVCLDDNQPQAINDNQHDHCSSKLPVRNGQNVRHTEASKREFKEKSALSAPTSAGQTASRPSINRDPGTMEWKYFTHVAEYFPEPPLSKPALIKRIYDLGGILGICQEGVKRGIDEAGIEQLVVIFDDMIARGDEIQKPDAFLKKILRTWIPRHGVRDPGQNELCKQKN